LRAEEVDKEIPHLRREPYEFMRLIHFAEESGVAALPRRKPRAWLEIRRGTARHKLRPIGGPVYLIGRSEDCDLVLADPRFPEIHAYLLLDEERVLLRFLGHGPEITVDGRPVEAVELLHGDRLRTGPYEFRLHLGDAPGPRGKSAEREKRHAKGRLRVTSPPPLEIVRALLADVRARFAGGGCRLTGSASAADKGRDAA
jgi:hypothetical protein